MYPHTIDNGHGERMTFLGIEGDRLRIQSTVDPGAGPPMHVHHLESETVRVRSGRIGIEVRPPHNMEYFLTQIYASTAAHGGRPEAFDAAFLLTRYRSEFAMTAIPAPIRRIVFPIQARLGRLLGRYPQYADAPAPVKPIVSATLPGRTTSARSSAG